MAKKVATLYAELKLEDQLTPGLRSGERALDRFGEKTRGAALDMGKLTMAAGVVSAAVTGATVAMIGLANEGTKIAQTSAAFDRLAGSSAEADKWIRAMQSASRGSLTEFEATNQAIQLMTMGLADSADEAGRFMEIAAITKAINPELGSMENTITNIGMTLANDSWMRLDQLGVDATELKKRIEELKQEGIAMTEAFDIGVMEQLEENAKLIGTDVLEIGKNTAQMQANWREAKDSASEFALIVMEEVSPKLSEAATAADMILQTLTNLASGDWEISVVLKAIAEEITGLDLATTPEELKARNMTNYGMTFAERAGYARGTPGLPNVYADQMLGTMSGLMPEWWQQGLGATYSSGPVSVRVVNSSDIALAVGPRGIPQEDLLIEAIQAQSRAALEMVTKLPSFKGALESSVPIYVERGGQLAAPPKSTGSYATPAGLNQIYGDQLMANAGRQVVAPFGRSSALQAMGDAQLMNTLWSVGDILQGGGSPGGTFGGIKTAAVDMDALAQASARFADNIERVEAMKDVSLSEKLGIGGASRLESDVYREMQDALRGVTDETGAAAEAMQIYELQTGLATGASEIFQGQMDMLAQKLADGEISAQEYVSAVNELSMMDMSQINDVIAGLIQEGDIETAQRYIEKWSALEDITTRFFGNGPVEDPNAMKNPALDMLRAGSEDEKGGPLQAVIDDLGLVQEGASAAFDPAIEDVNSVSSMLDTIAATQYRSRLIIDVATSPETVGAFADLVLQELERRGSLSLTGAGG